jgi:uroporphyrinogen decarboxylase
MLHRENLLLLYRRQGYEFAPVSFFMCPSLDEEFAKRYPGRAVEEVFDFSAGTVRGLRFPETNEDWLRFYPEPLKPGTKIDTWGVAHEPGSEAAKHMTYMRHPMAHLDSLEQIKAYPYPDVTRATSDHMAAAVQRLHAAGKAAVGSMECTVWESAWYLRGMDNLFVDMTEESEMAVYLLDKVTEISCANAGAFAHAGADVIHMGDDIGMQHTIMMSQGMYRTWLKPRLKKIIATAKAAKPDILIQYHSCGLVEPLIDDLIEAGIDILNPVQPECMDFQKIHDRFGDRLSFNGTVGTQTTMPFGSPKDVRKVVQRNLRIAGPKGGLCCCPTHLLEPEVPWENIEAYAKACCEFKPV